MLTSLESQAYSIIEREALTGVHAVMAFEMGVGMQNRGDDEQAWLYFTIARILVPDCIEFYNTSHQIPTKLRYQFAGFALDILNDAVEHSPQSAQLYRNRGFIHEIINQDDDALHDYDEAIRLDLSNADNYFDRALIYEKLHRYNEALKDYLQVIKLRPEDHQAHVFAGLIFANTDRMQKALYHFEVAAHLGNSEGRTLAIQLRQLVESG